MSRCVSQNCALKQKLTGSGDWGLSPACKYCMVVKRACISSAFLWAYMQTPELIPQQDMQRSFWTRCTSSLSQTTAVVSPLYSEDSQTHETSWDFIILLSDKVLVNQRPMCGRPNRIAYGCGVLFKKETYLGAEGFWVGSHDVHILFPW